MVSRFHSERRQIHGLRVRAVNVPAGPELFADSDWLEARDKRERTDTRQQTLAELFSTAQHVELHTPLAPPSIPADPEPDSRSEALEALARKREREQRRADRWNSDTLTQSGLTRAKLTLGATVLVSVAFLSGLYLSGHRRAVVTADGTVIEAPADSSTEAKVAAAQERLRRLTLPDSTREKLAAEQEARERAGDMH